MGSDSFWSSILIFCHAIAFKRCIPLILTCILFQCLKEENKNAPSECFKPILASIVFAWLAVMKGRGPCPINYLLRIGDTHLQILDIGTLVCSTIGSNNFKKPKMLLKNNLNISFVLSSKSIKSVFQENWWWKVVCHSMLLLLSREHVEHGHCT